MFNLLLLFLSIQVSLAEDKYISVSNGGSKGKWGSTEVCPDGSVAMGFKVKVERKSFQMDNTGLNTIYLICGKPSSENIVGTVTSSEGDFGTIGPEHKCILGSYLVAFSLRVGKRILFDDVGASNMKAKCSDGTVLTGDGTNTGNWGDFSDECPGGIRGIKTRMESYQGMFFDDTMLNDAYMLCSDSQFYLKGTI